jgi:hypothetical protein
MGIPAKPLACADKKPVAREYLMKYYKERLGHLFKNNRTLTATNGFCTLHGKDCAVPQEAVSCGSGGLPCQPFTRQRQTTGGTAKTGCAETHPSHATVFDEWLEFLEAVSPAQWWVEEVPDFQKYVHEFGEKCARKGYSVRAFTINHNEFLKMPRERSSVCKQSRIHSAYVSHGIVGNQCKGCAPCV